MPFIQPHRKPVRLLVPFVPFNAGEIAGFPDAEADDLVRRGIATFDLDGSDATVTTTAATPETPSEFLCTEPGCPRGVAGSGYKSERALTGHMADKHAPETPVTTGSETPAVTTGSDATVTTTDATKPEEETPPPVALEDLELTDLVEIAMKLEEEGKVNLDGVNADDKDALIEVIRSATKDEADGGTEQPSA